MAEKKTSLRVLYTINSSHQYILARSHLPVTVAVIPPVDDNQGTPSTASQSVPLYASVSLRTCLDTICRSSPELTMLDNTRDFSVYVLDPLESNSAPKPVHIPNGEGEGTPTTPPPAQPRGVAVGLGLMSWTLMADERDAASVVGTIVKQGTLQEALEVIFSLRETAGTKKPMWNTSSTSSQLPSSQESVSSFNSSQGEGNPLQCPPLNQVRSSSSYQRGVSSTSTYSNQPFHDEATRETLTSIQTRTRPKSKPIKPVRQSKVPVTGSDQFMDADTYIGPAKKKGRPKTTIAEPRPGAFQGNTIASGSGLIQPEVIVIDSDSETEWGMPTPTAGKVQPACNRAATSTKRKPTSQHPITRPFTIDPLVRCPPQPEPNSTTFQVKVEPEESEVAHPNENATILATLSAIDSSVPHFLDHAVPNPALASRVRHLLALYRTHLVPSIPGPSAPTPPPPAPPTPARPSSSQHQQHRRSSSSSQNEIVVLDKENVNPVAFKKPAGKDSYDTTLSDPVAKASPAVHLSRQNTQPERHVKGLGTTSRSNEAQSTRLSMNLPNQSSGLGRKRTLSDTMDEKERRHREKGKQRERRDGHRQSSSQYPQLSAGSDVLRHYPRLRDSNEPRIEQPSNYYRTPLESLTSPARPPSEGDDEAPNPTPEPFRSTSPIKPPSSQLPRVSASSPVRAPRQSIRKGYVVPEWAVTNTATQPRLSEEAQRAQQELEGKKKQEKRERSKLKRNRSTSALQAEMRPPEVRRLPKEAEPICGPIAASNAGPLIAATDITFPIIASSRSSSPPPNPISIPKTPKTPTRNRSIRATPGGENDSLFTPGPASGSLFGSSYCRHSPRGSPPSYLTSPLGSRKKPRMSPRSSSLTDRSPKPFTSANDSEERQEAKSLPHPGAEDVLEDLDCPPDSLPFAISDDVDEVSQQPSASFDFDARTPVKQHWPGLPPSSPPAPSSPLLQIDFDLPSDDEMAEVPIATSDSEADADMSAFESDATSPTGYNPPYSNDQLTTAMDHELFSFFSADTHSFGHQNTAFPSMDLFEQYTNLNAQSDDMQTFSTTDNSNLNELLQNGLDGMDYTEFWETFNPLVADNTHLVPQSTDADLGAFLDGADNSLLPSFGEVDRNKLAEDLHALLGGCVM